MKKKVKKLTLSKETLRNLEGTGLRDAVGASLPTDTCLPCATAATDCSCAFSQCCESKLMRCFSPPTGT